MLRRQGYTVIGAENGEEAISRWEESRDAIDLLITDMVMPGRMTGLDLARKMRADNPGLKVILTSGYSTDLLEQKEGAAARIRHLPKPCTPAILLGTIREILNTDANSRPG